MRHLVQAFFFEQKPEDLGGQSSGKLSFFGRMLSFFFWILFSKNAQFSSEVLSFLEFYLVKISVFFKMLSFPPKCSVFFFAQFFFEMFKKAWFSYVWHFLHTKISHEENQGVQ